MDVAFSEKIEKFSELVENILQLHFISRDIATKIIVRRKRLLTLLSTRNALPEFIIEILQKDILFSCDLFESIKNRNTSKKPVISFLRSLFSIFWSACLKYPNIIQLWVDFISFAHKCNYKTLSNRILSRALCFNPQSKELFNIARNVI